MTSIRLASVLIIATIFFSACGNTVRPCYLALGDSYAFGEGATRPNQTSYVALFHRSLEQDRDEQISLRSFAVRGETTKSIIAEGQLAKALAELHFRNQDEDTDDDVFVITVQIGGNDLLRLADDGAPCAPPAALDDPKCARAFSDAIHEVTVNLPAILRDLRVAAGDDARILVLDYFNPFSGSGKPLDETGDLALPALNDVIAEAARSPDVNAEFVSLFDEFRGRSADLTHVTEPEGDIHPNDAGHRLIADLLLSAYKD